MRFDADDIGDEAMTVGVAVRGRSRCSPCGLKCPRYDSLETRRRRHLDFDSWLVFLEPEIYRVTLGQDESSRHHDRDHTCRFAHRPGYGSSVVSQ